MDTHLLPIYILLCLENNIYNDLDSFQNGVDTIIAKCVELGSTPTESTPDAICTSISEVYALGQAAGKSLYYLGNISHSTTLLTSSRIASFDYTTLPNYESLTVDDFIIGKKGSDRITNKTGSATSYVSAEIKSTGTLRVKWWGSAETSSCTLNIDVYAIA